MALATITYTGPRDFKSLEAAALKASRDHADTYIVVAAAGFDGYDLCLYRSLPRSARSIASNSGPLKDGYFLNGKRRSWTEKQIIADQQDWRCRCQSPDPHPEASGFFFARRACSSAACRIHEARALPSRLGAMADRSSSDSLTFTMCSRTRRLPSLRRPGRRSQSLILRALEIGAPCPEDLPTEIFAV